MAFTKLAAVFIATAANVVNHKELNLCLTTTGANFSIAFDRHELESLPVSSRFGLLRFLVAVIVSAVLPLDFFGIFLS